MTVELQTDTQSTTITKSTEQPKNSENALRDRLCSPLSSSLDYPPSVDSASSSTYSSSTSSTLPNVQDPSHTSDSSALIVQRPRFKEDLNWCGREEIVDNLALFDEAQKHLIRSVIQKQDHYPEGFDKGNYFQSIYPIIASGFVDAAKIVFCGARCSYGGRPCRRWQLCSRCAYYRGYKACQRYGAAFNKSEFSHLTCSFDGSVSLDVTNSVDLRTYWKANESAIRRAFNEGLIDGAYIVHELAILSFLPLRVLPHSHILVSGDPFTVDRLSVISGYIDEAEGVELVPSLQNRTLKTKKEFGFVIKYQTKAIKLKEPYEAALVRHGRLKQRDLNLEMKTFLDDFSAATDGLQKVVRIGNLHPQRGKLYIGTTAKDADKAERARKKRATRERRLRAYGVD